ncbi:SCP-1 multi-domain protein [Pyrenophora teres f. maculata]|nr:SCP-1 multi-domain protein [Pyrenophora teres f. maculata]
MSFDLDALFREPEDLHLLFEKPATSRQNDQEFGLAGGLYAADPNDEDARAKGYEEIRLREVVAKLSIQCNTWKVQAEQQAKMIADLDRRTSKRAAADLSDDTVRRINRFESEVARLRSENSQLKETLKTIEYEKVKLENQNDGKGRKLKGANKKVKNAKEVAGKEEERAKGAIGDKQRHLTSERKMKKERDQAQAAFQEQKKINGDLLEKLEVEQSGMPFMRDAAADPNNTVAVVPIQFDIRRIGVQPIMEELKWHQMNIKEKFEAWYKQRMKPKEEIRRVVGATYVEDDKKKARIYGDMVEIPDGYMENGAEHDGWRSKRSAESVCRRAEARHNGEG